MDSEVSNKLCIELFLWSWIILLSLNEMVFKVSLISISYKGKVELFLLSWIIYTSFKRNGLIGLKKSAI